MAYPAVLIFSLILSFAFTLVIRRVALRFKIQDAPAGARKQHARPVPLLGGLAVYLAFFGAAFTLSYFHILPREMSRPLFWLFVSSTVLMFGGFLDDKYVLPPKLQIFFPLVSVLLALWGGIKINLITNPAGGILYLAPAVALVLSFFWLLIITYTTKILDGLDGLVSGVVSLGGLSIFLFSTISKFKESGIPYLALVLTGVFAGFLILNFYPARIFLGEGGSLFAGFILGALAIMTGAKIAVTLMVLALPLIDLAAVVIKRLAMGRPVWRGDRLHLHYLLVDRGWKPRNVVLLFWFFSAVLGAVAIFLPSGAKVAVLSAVCLIFFMVDLFRFKEK